MAPRSVRLRSVATLSLGALTFVSLQGCAETYGPQTYSPYQQGVVARVEEGSILSFRQIQFAPGDTAGGTIAGGVGGAVIGSALAGRGSHGVGAVLGGIGGALIGNAVENGQRSYGFAYLVRLSNGRDIEVPQADRQPIPVGSRVSVSFSRGFARVTPFGGYASAPPPPPPPPPPPR